MLLAQQNNCGKIMNIIVICINIIVCMWLFSLDGKERFECGTLTVARFNIWLQHRTSATLNVHKGLDIERLQH